LIDASYQFHINIQCFILPKQTLTLLSAGVGDVDEVTSVTVYAEVVVFEASAFFCFVFGVILVVLPQLAESVSKLAPLFVGTIPVFHVFFTELGLQLGVLAINGSFLIILGGVGGTFLIGPFLSAQLGLGRL